MSGRLRPERLPARWSPASSGAATLAGSGRAELVLAAPRAGRYAVWAQGSFPGRLAVSVGGRAVGAVRGRLQQEIQYVRIATVRLRAGRHRITLAYDRGGWRPGGGGAPAALGDVVLAPTGAEDVPALLDVPAAGWRRLCGRTLDWIAVLGAPTARSR